MIGFIKWLICQYRAYKIEQIFKTSQEDNEKYFLNLLSQCGNYGFTVEQMMYVLNLENACNGNKKQ